MVLDGGFQKKARPLVLPGPPASIFLHSGVLSEVLLPNWDEPSGLARVGWDTGIPLLSHQHPHWAGRAQLSRWPRYLFLTKQHVVWKGQWLPLLFRPGTS